ncbi:hypothetical protein KP509_25G050000 [Ceratopteris richardii]|uniref:Uncharacterized protein n=1 Tax=Ceratopteris richardii TaxID=49495 RepID=A0A8T2RQ58_CERRI|nr:hypothetical protein KP509_25G050000 [Ceratopteris richardii]
MSENAEIYELNRREEHTREKQGEMAEGHVLLQQQQSPAIDRAAVSHLCLMNRPFHLRPSLVELCVPILSKQPDILTLLASLPPAICSQVISKLPLDLPLLPCSQFIHDEEYWKKRALLKWKKCDTSNHGRSWKQLFFECNLADALEKQLSSLKLEYGWKNAGMLYDPDKFGMKVSDCLAFSASLYFATTLTNLDLSCNHLDDDKVKILLKGMMSHPCLLRLNLCHNRVGDVGVAVISKFLVTEKCILTDLSLGDNYFTSQGGKDLAEALKTNTLLSCLNLGYNRKIGDEGGRAILDGLQSNSSLQGLSLASCGLGEESMISLGKAISSSRSGLLYLDVSANPSIGVKAGAALQESIESGKPPLYLDLQSCGLGEEAEQMIANAIIKKYDKGIRPSLLQNNIFRL